MFVCCLHMLTLRYCIQERCGCKLTRNTYPWKGVADSNLSTYILRILVCSLCVQWYIVCYTQHVYACHVSVERIPTPHMLRIPYYIVLWDACVYITYFLILFYVVGMYMYNSITFLLFL